VTKPPKSTPHSDVDGIYQDERSNIDTAVDVGEDSKDLKRAQEETVARPPHADDMDGLADRSR